MNVCIRKECCKNQRSLYFHRLALPSCVFGFSVQWAEPRKFTQILILIQLPLCTLKFSVIYYYFFFLSFFFLFFLAVVSFRYGECECADAVNGAVAVCYCFSCCYAIGLIVMGYCQNIYI